MIGRLTLDRHREFREQGLYLHVFVHGVDVTWRCLLADDTLGHAEAQLYKLNVDGRTYLDTYGEPAIEIVHDGIEIRQRASGSMEMSSL